MRCAGTIALIAALLSTACWRIGEPTESAAVITWAAFPDTVVVGQPFSFEFAGPVSPDACGRMDTAIVHIEGSVIRLSGRRSVYDTMCANSPVAFYEARPLLLSATPDPPGRVAGFNVVDPAAKSSGSRAPRN